MGARTGKYSRFIFDELKRYHGILMQKGLPLADADFNDWAESFTTQVRRFLQFTVGSGSPNDGFKIEEATSTTNNFKIKGGDGTAEGAGRIFVEGFQGLIPSDIDFLTNNIEVHSYISGLTDTVLTDTAANFDVDELIGRELVPDISKPAVTFTILSNTATTITVASGLLAAANGPTAITFGTFYRVNPSTPLGAARTDIVYVDMYLDEVDSVEDSNLIHNFLIATESMRRLKLRQVIRIKEGVTAAPANFTDANGNFHATLSLARVDRLYMDDTITTAMITDERALIADLLSASNEVADGRASDLLGTFPTLDDRLEAAEDRFNLVANSPLVRTTPAGIINIDLPNASGGGPGAMSAADFTKLAGIEVGATAGNVDAAEVDPDDASFSNIGDFSSELSTDEPDGETYLKLTCNANSESIDVSYSVLMLTTEISQIIVPHKFSNTGGANVMTIRILDNDGSVLATKSATLSTSRTTTTILPGDLSADPVGRLIIKLSITSDQFDTAEIGKSRVEFA